MMNDSDMQLVARYVHQHDEDAFAELVRRHLDLVHSAALRQVRSHQLAEEVAQSVFLHLARGANRLAPNSILSAWLYQVTRRTAIDTIRRESRRQTREQSALDLNAINEPAPEWPQIETLLDEAMESLNDTDRAAVLLRYFQDRSMKDIGHALGTSEDAAQKRISRAIERLRDWFDQRGVAIGSGGLVTVLVNHAVQAAPTGLAAGIAAVASAASGTLGISTASTAGASFGGFLWHKPLAVSALVAALGSGLYALHQQSLLRDQGDALRSQQAQATRRNALIARERDNASNQLQLLGEENNRLAREAAEVHKLRGDMVRLRQQLAESAPTELNEPATTVQQETRRRAFGTELQDMGAATPERAATSLIWAAHTGDASRLSELLELPTGVTESDAPKHYEFFARRFSNAWNQFEFLAIQAAETNPDGSVTLRQLYRDPQTGKTNPFPFILRLHDSTWRVVVEGDVPHTLPTE